MASIGHPTGESAYVHWNLTPAFSQFGPAVSFSGAQAALLFLSYKVTVADRSIWVAEWDATRAREIKDRETATASDAEASGEQPAGAGERSDVQG